MPKTSSINSAVYTEYCKFVLVMTVNFGFIPHLLTSLTLLHFIYPAVQNTNAEKCKKKKKLVTIKLKNNLIVPMSTF